MNSSTPLPIEERECFTTETISLRITRIIPYLLIMPISILGNILIMYIVYKDSSLHKAVNYFIITMATSDLFITIVYMPRVLTIILYGYDWLLLGTLGDILCKSVSFLYESAVIVSLLTIVAISIDRLFAVVWPFRPTIGNTKVKVIIFTIWLIALVSRSPILFAAELVLENNRYFCFALFGKTFHKGADMLYYKLTVIVFYAAPLAAITISYACILSVLYRRQIPVEMDQSQHIERINRQVLHMVLAVVGSFILCWLIYFIVMALRIYSVNIPCDLFYMRMLLAHSNCAINPCLYIALSTNYRQGFQSLLKRLKSRCFSENDHTECIGSDNLAMVELSVCDIGINTLPCTVPMSGNY